MNAQSEFKPVLIRASAGTGKTYRLTNRLIALLAAGESPERIIASTFTRKAAGEIRDRLFERLASAGEDPKKAKLLAEEIHCPAFTAEKSLELLLHVVKYQHRLNICTLDSLFAKMAGSFPIELELPFQWRILEAHESDILQAEAVGSVLKNNDTVDLVGLMQLLNKGDARRSVHRQIINEVSTLYELYRHTKEESWLWLDPPTPLSKEEIQELLTELEQEELPTTKSGTPLKRWVDARAEGIAAIERGDWNGFLAKGIAKAVSSKNDSFQNKPISPAMRTIYQKLIRHASAFLLLQLKRQTLSTLHLLSLFSEEFEAKKLSIGGLGFSDIKYLLAQARFLGNLDEIYYRLDTRISHLLLDEFQDTSADEWQVLKPIADEILSKSGTEYSFFCVGDVKQAIYGWRGGVAEIFDTLRQDYPALTEESMEKSYRSAKEIMEFSNMVFQKISENSALVGANENASSPAVRAAKSWESGFRTHQAAYKDIPGYVQISTAPRAEDDCNQTDVDATFIAQSIKKIAEEAPNQSIGVLVRTNKTIGRLIFELRKKSVSVEASEEGGNPLTDSAAVSLLLSVLRFADYPGDSICRFRLATSPLGSHLGYIDFHDSPLAAKTAAVIRKNLLDNGYGKTLFDWTTALDGSLSPRDHTRVQQLVELGKSYDNTATLRPHDFINFVQSKKVEDPSGARVRVMTIHQAKGLEFDIVILPELNVSLVGKTTPKILTYQKEAMASPDMVVRYASETIRRLDPLLEEMSEQREMREVKEALSVFYVALTRAKHALHIILPPMKENSRKLPQSFAGLIRSVVAPEDSDLSDEIRYQMGDPQWFSKLSRTENVKTQETKRPPLSIQLSSPSKKNRGLTRQSPSGLEGSAGKTLGETLRIDDPRALSRGTLIHLFFEQIAWLDETLPSPEDLHTLALSRLPSALNLDSLISEFYQMLQHPEIDRQLRKELYLGPEVDQVDAQREFPFAIRENNTLLSGTIDRLVISSHQGTAISAEVIDYKTDHISSEAGLTLKDKISYYRPQLESYRRVAAKITNLHCSQVSAKLFFVSSGDVCNVTS